jgi:hypothetical protein
MAEPETSSHAQGHEAIHLPPPSIWPAVVALSIALLLTGLIINRVVTIVGAIIFVVASGLWVRDARREFRALAE